MMIEYKIVKKVRQLINEVYIKKINDEIRCLSDRKVIQ
jgi:hypothetical protein